MFADRPWGNIQCTCDPQDYIIAVRHGREQREAGRALESGCGNHLYVYHEDKLEGWLAGSIRNIAAPIIHGKLPDTAARQSQIHHDGHADLQSCTLGMCTCVGHMCRT